MDWKLQVQVTRISKSGQDKILWDFQVWTDKQVIVDNLNTVVVVKVREKKTLIINVAIQNGNNTRVKEYEKQ